MAEISLGCNVQVEGLLENAPDLIEFVVPELSTVSIFQVEIGTTGVRSIITTSADGDSFPQREEVLLLDEDLAPLHEPVLELDESGNITHNAEAELAIYLRAARREASARNFSHANFFVTATEAFRKAPNWEDVCRRLEIGANTEINILTQRAEALITGISVRAEMEHLTLGESTALVVEIGGGSIQLSLASRSELRVLLQLPVGTRRLLEELGSLPEDVESLTTQLDQIDPLQQYGVIETLGEEFREDAPTLFVLVGGSALSVRQLSEANGHGNSYFEAKEELLTLLNNAILDRTETAQALGGRVKKLPHLLVSIPIIKELLELDNFTHVLASHAGVQSGIHWLGVSIIERTHHVLMTRHSFPLLRHFSGNIHALTLPALLSKGELEQLEKLEQV